MNEKIKGSMKSRDHHYTFKGKRYNNRLECKNGVAREGGMRKVSDSLFNNLLALGVVQKFIY
jgi:hypothetical protein